MPAEESNEHEDTNQAPTAWQRLRTRIRKDALSTVLWAVKAVIVTVALYFICLIFRDYESMFQTFLSWPVITLAALLIFRRRVSAVFDSIADRIRAMKSFAAKGRTAQVDALFYPPGDFEGTLERHREATTTTQGAVVDVATANARADRNAAIGFLLGTLAGSKPYELLGVLQSVRTGKASLPGDAGQSQVWMLLRDERVIIEDEHGNFQFAHEAGPIVDTTLDMLKKALYKPRQGSLRGAYSIQDAPQQ